jgi:malate synthase
MIMEAQTVETVYHKGSRDIAVLGPLSNTLAEILSPEALTFVAALEREFGDRRRALLVARSERQREFNEGRIPSFLPETRAIRNSAWHIGSVPSELLDRRVEITGPVDRKMIINGLNSGANVFMADFEDSLSPTWSNIIVGQSNLIDAVNGSISYLSPEGKEYQLKPHHAVLMVRPRGWHLEERHILVHGRSLSASLVDFGLFFFHNCHTLLSNGTAPYFYIPKLESHLEARLWNDVFLFAQEYMGIAPGTIKATVLIETLTAAFEMEEILYEMREHITGLNCGRWDYIFSFIKKFRTRPGWVLPERAQLTMMQHFLRSYSLRLIQTCHRRGAHAMGGMAAEIPLRGSNQSTLADALEKVREDKEREVQDGHDGTWVAHPGLVPIARAVFDSRMAGPNQLERAVDGICITATDLLDVPSGDITEEGVRTNIRAAVHYVASWLGGIGCVPIAGRMEDAATAEISRSQLWQWLHAGETTLRDGRQMTLSLVERLFVEEVGQLQATGPRLDYAFASDVVLRMIKRTEFTEFFTLEAYDHLVTSRSANEP